MQLSAPEIMQKGIQCLIENLGEVETEYFIFNLKRQTFNYTEWQSDYFAQNFTLDTFLQKAKNVDEEQLRKNKDCRIM